MNIVFIITSLLLAVGWTEARSIRPLSVSLDGNDGVENLEGLSELFADIIEFNPIEDDEKTAVKSTPKPTIDYSNRVPVVEEEIKKATAYVLCGEKDGLNCGHGNSGQQKSVTTESTDAENNDSSTDNPVQSVVAEQATTDEEAQATEDPTEEIRGTVDYLSLTTTEQTEENDEESAKNDEESAKNDEESAKVDEESAKNDEESAKNDEESAKNDEESTKNDEESAKNDENIEEEETEQSETKESENNLISTPSEEKDVQAITEESINNKESSPANDEQLAENEPQPIGEESSVTKKPTDENSLTQNNPLNHKPSDQKAHQKDSDENDSDSDSDSDSSEENDSD